MYGKLFESTFEGSMFGAGCHVFALWAYAVAHAKRGCGVVDLNPTRLAAIIGTTTNEVQSALDYLSAPDPNSKHKSHEGRRLVLVEGFQYLLPTWEHYQSLRDPAERREYNRKAQQRRRERLLTAARKVLR